MDKVPKSANIEKFMNLEESKRDRIINAAMKEFRYGYKKASTDAIAKEAKISKGLLFHYFGTKEQLLGFLAKYCTDVMFSNYVEMTDVGQKDILEGFWQAALYRKRISDKYPHIYDFTVGIQANLQDIPVEMLASFWEMQEIFNKELYGKIDTSLFRDDIDYTKAVDIIFWGIDGLFMYENAKKIASSDNNDDYEKFLEDLRGYIDIFRLCFYK